jgi:hypothetical protein
MAPRQSTGENKARNAKNSAKFVSEDRAQIGGGQGEVQGRLVAIYLSAKTVTFPLLLRIRLRAWKCTSGIRLLIGSAPLT